MSYGLFIFLNILLIQLPFSTETACQYYESPSTPKYTDASYLSSANEEEEKKQKCFSLSNSDINNLCCYNKNTKQCETGSTTSDPVYCPDISDIKNNCGMALFYQPVSKEACTEISLVNGYCCFVKTNSRGNACLKQDEITDYMKDYFRNRLGINPDTEIKSVQCEGSLLKYYGFLMILLSVICL